MAWTSVGCGLRAGRNPTDTGELVAAEGRVGGRCVLGRVCQAGTESQLRDVEGALCMAKGRQAEAACIEGLFTCRNSACAGGAAGAQCRWQACHPPVTVEV